MDSSAILPGVFARLPVMKAFRKLFRGRFIPTRRRQLRAMLHAFKQWGGSATPVIGIIDWEGLPTAPEFEMFKAFFEEAGIKTVICDPRALEFRRGKLYAQGKAVNLVYRRGPARAAPPPGGGPPPPRGGGAARAARGGGPPFPPHRRPQRG